MMGTRKMSRFRRKKGFFWQCLLIVIACLFATLPMAWIITCSFQPDSAYYEYPPKLFPAKLYFGNYRFVLNTSKIPLNMLNSLIVCGFTCIITLLFGSMAGFALSRTRSRYKNLLFLFVLITQMVPSITLIIPLYFISYLLNILNTRLVLILVYSALNLPLTTIVLSNFYDILPRELDEAAFLDGCGKLQYFFFVAVRLISPGLAAMGVLVFVNSFNEFVISLTLIYSSDLKTYQLGLYNMLSAADIYMQYGWFNAAATLGLIPILIIYMFTHRNFVQGISEGVLK